MKMLALGPKGSNGHEAAKKASSTLGLFERRIINFCNNHEEILCGVAKNIGVQGVVPIENTIAGHVPDVIEFWTNNSNRNKVGVVGEIHLPIHHQLLVHRNVLNVEEITSVVSHPHALGQTEKSLKKLPLIIEKVPSKSTSLAAQEVASGSLLSRAAIASRFAGEIYKLKVIRENIEDVEDNETRFHILGIQKPLPTGRDRTAILCVVGNTPGALKGVINSIEANISSIKIPISLGSRERCGLYLEFDEHTQTSKGKKIMKRIKSAVEDVFVLGSFPKERGR